mmetsp:Transcript_7133/g.8201  ORF Transcript_7133/g.8201 Transcript_7133/m.8201 type:complete len:1049 (-) Transcript_7133:100-3246(-)|eukprot:CAMPEP_0194423532 /NCGR_PEP_ID=MMETSP0176-20130528/22750_1 /TAXON_ID=216777 /ORGANISM="Proboscia alata, Strain PI-D3" /LENGTH=1048 /DNA_ID=CAMNT_0039232773 /DNA_START=216 /DNA_END=3362 /DNA_ORIENTATION=+
MSDVDVDNDEDLPEGVVVEFDSRADRDTLVNLLQNLLKNNRKRNRRNGDWLFYSLIYNLSRRRDDESDALFYGGKAGVEGFFLLENGPKKDWLNMKSSFEKQLATDNFSKELKRQSDKFLWQSDIYEEMDHAKPVEHKIFKISLSNTSQFKKAFDAYFGCSITESELHTDPKLKKFHLPRPTFFSVCTVGAPSSNETGENISKGIESEKKAISDIYNYGGSRNDEYMSMFAMEMIYECLQDNSFDLTSQIEAAVLLGLMGTHFNKDRLVDDCVPAKGDVKVPKKLQKLSSLLSLHTHLLGDDISSNFVSTDSTEELFIRPRLVDPSNDELFCKIIFFAKFNLEMILHKNCRVGFPPLKVEVKVANPEAEVCKTALELNILPRRVFDYLKTAQPVGAAVVANAILTTIARKVKPTGQNADERFAYIKAQNIDIPDVLNVYNVPAVKAWCATVGFNVDLGKYGSNGTAVLAYFDIPSVLGVYGKAMIKYCEKNIHENSSSPKDFHELPYVSKFLPALLEMRLEGERGILVEYHNGAFFEQANKEAMLQVELGSRVQDSKCPLIGVSPELSYDHHATVCAELIGRRSKTNTGFLVTRSLLTKHAECVGITSAGEDTNLKTGISSKKVFFAQANIVAGKVPSSNRCVQTKFPKEFFFVLMSVLFDFLSIVGAVALFLIGLASDDPLIIFVAVIELTAEVLTRLVTIFLLRFKGRTFSETFVAILSPIDYTIRISPGETPAFLWRLPLRIEGMLSLFSAIVVSASISGDDFQEEGLWEAAPSILAVLLVLGKGNLANAFIEFFNFTEDALMDWKEIGPTFLVSYLLSLATQLILLNGVKSETWWLVLAAYLGTLGNAFETILAFVALAPITSGTISDYEAVIFIYYYSSFFRGSNGYIPTKQREPKIDRKWAVVKKVDSDGTDSLCTTVLVDEDNLLIKQDLEASTSIKKPLVPLGCSTEVPDRVHKNAPLVAVPSNFEQNDSLWMFLRSNQKHSSKPAYQVNGINLHADTQDNQSSFQLEHMNCLDANKDLTRDASVTDFGVENEDGGRIVL